MQMFRAVMKPILIRMPYLAQRETDAGDTPKSTPLCWEWTDFVEFSEAAHTGASKNR